MNKVVLIGRLTKDPELKFTPGTGTAVATFTIAVDRKFKREGQQEADFIPIVVWGKAAENTANYMSKGRLIGIAGRIETRSYEGKDGIRRYVTEVVADEVQFLDKGSKQPDTNNGYGFQDSGFGGNQSTQGFTPAESNFGSEVTPMDDDDIPF
ncbi:single-strand binding protein [Clostridium collagenovorans DSM 3089]|uniref:Single-stranded DNA-binding protein n=1 Tax=Clostridium collagenovorans DSM 3089 TaxID=1121306 RepID=A0A1M5YFZ9_9CLOT|nr:single-stranded DNA-binding protein [Clostridium collagenovorans]SHI10965.1 single-strand binding protein [Clostridium collagenovorans DSM 3089]